MYKTVVILYLFVYSTYILFTREPDFFNGETIPASIRFMQDSAAAGIVPKAVFTLNRKEYAVNADYLFRSYTGNEKVTVIYELSNPAKAAVYSWWGYWIRWKELISSIVLVILLFQVAVGITKNPTPEALIEELESKPPRKRRYS